MGRNTSWVTVPKELKTMQVGRPTVSVIIVSWNACRYLKQCLGSLTDKTCSYPMEVIVVDNASTDGSAEMVQKDFPHVILIRNSKNLGFAKANNIGIHESRGEYICMVNSDVEVLPDCITELVTFCAKNSRVGLVGPRVRGGDGKLQRTCRGYPTLWNMCCRALALDRVCPKVHLFSGYALQHWSQEDLRDVDILTGCFWLARRRAVEDVGLLDETFFMYGEDMDWCKRFGDAGWRVVFTPTAHAIHYGGASSGNAPVRFYIERHRADFQYWKKHHSRFALVMFFVICFLHLALRAIGYGMSSCYNNRRSKEHRQKLQRSVACLEWMILRRIPYQQSSGLKL